MNLCTMPPLIAVNADDVAIGTISKHACHLPGGILHRAFSVFLIDAQGEVLLQRRSQLKPLWPGWWANSCCSHPVQGESLPDAVRRRVFEELGLRIDTAPQWRFQFVYHADYLDVGSEHELCHVFTVRLDVRRPPLNPEPGEVAELRWHTPDEIDVLLADIDAPYAPWFRLEWPRLRAAGL